MKEIATFAGGCFWCTEAIFKRLKGVTSVLPGYSGGNVKNPTSEEVYGGGTGHVEVVQIEFDPKIIPYEKLLDIFWDTHDPTSMDKQGYDVGPLYRSVIFYHNENQRKVAEESKKKIEEEGTYKRSIVTEIKPFSNFYVAEDYHKNYFENHKNSLYCNVIISPKIKKLLSKYGKDVKEEYRE